MLVPSIVARPRPGLADNIPTPGAASFALMLENRASD
jgi:hypothetical protein